MKSLIQNLSKSTDPWSESIYDWIDKQIEKSGLKIPGQHPQGTKVLGKQVEKRLYSGLQKRLWNALKSIERYETQAETLQKLENAIDAWRRRMYEGVEDADKELLRRGYIAGLIDSGQPIEPERYDENINVLMMDENRLEPKFQEFRKETVSKVRSVVAESYNEDGLLDQQKLEDNQTTGRQLYLR